MFIIFGISHIPIKTFAALSSNSREGRVKVNHVMSQIGRKNCLLGNFTSKILRSTDLGHYAREMNFSK